MLREQRIMKKIYSKLRFITKNIIKNEVGAGLIEYAILISFIAIAVLIAVQTFGFKVNSLYTTITASL